MTRKKAPQTRRRIKQHGEGHIELGVEPRYVALRHMRFGDGWLQPGDPVPVEGGRDYGRMVRQGLIEQIIEPSEAA
jgi:hypothetical protein